MNNFIHVLNGLDEFQEAALNNWAIAIDINNPDRDAFKAAIKEARRDNVVDYEEEYILPVNTDLGHITLLVFIPKPRTNAKDCAGCPFIKECGQSISNMRLVNNGLCQIHQIEEAISKAETVLLVLDEKDINFLIDEGLWNDCEETYDNVYIVPRWINEKLEDFWEEIGQC